MGGRAQWLAYKVRRSANWYRYYFGIGSKTSAVSDHRRRIGRGIGYFIRHPWAWGSFQPARFQGTSRKVELPFCHSGKLRGDCRRARYPEGKASNCQTEGSLDIYAPRNTKYIRDLQQVFATTILKLDALDEFSGDNRVYHLDPLGNRDFVFQYPVGCGIESVTVCRLRLTLLSGRNRRVTLEVSPTHDSKAIYDLMELINPPSFHVTQAEIKVTFAPTPGARSRTRRFKISNPNWCALRHEGRDGIIREMLITSGIEPREPEIETAGNAA